MNTDFFRGNKALFLDDERKPSDVTWVELPDVEWHIVRTFWDFRKWIAEHGIPEIVSFDHDLGDPTYDGKKCAEFLYGICIMDDIPFPSKYFIHSMNPVGALNIENHIKWCYSMADS